jgi:hypothetical protein
MYRARRNLLTIFAVLLRPPKATPLKYSDVLPAGCCGLSTAETAARHARRSIRQHEQIS